jgi:tetratricopeptide (TPR) repeat protein
VASTEGKQEEIKSSIVSHYLYNKNEKEAEKIAEKAASDRAILDRIISEYTEGFWTFSNDDDAIWFFQKVLSFASEEPIKKTALTNLIIARNKKAWTYIRGGSLRESQDVLTESISKNMEDGETHLFLSILLRKLGSIEKADYELAKYLSFKPENDYDTYALFLHYAGLGEEAKTFFDEALKKPKNTLNTYVLYLIYLRETSQYEAMMDICAKIIKLDPSQPQTYHDYAYALTNLGRYKEAVDYLWKCIEHADILNDDVAVMYSDLMSTIRAQGR